MRNQNQMTKSSLADIAEKLQTTSSKRLTPNLSYPTKKWKNGRVETENPRPQILRKFSKKEAKYPGLKIFHQNTDRISNKIDRLNHLLKSISPDVLIFTEHGQDERTMENTRLCGYSLVSAFCRTNVVKGGVAIF
ncbi:hypothetical protein J6590_031619 [Homalodisca vitripennis]|nr:hypothetical protein J6590_031619 [Homalodisca vitripennis]